MNVLSQRIGPVPVWLLGAGAAVAIWFFFLRAKPGATSGTSAASGTSPSGQATTDYSLGYSQGLQAANVQPKPAAAGPPGGGATITVSNPNGPSVPIWSYNISSQGVIGNVPNGTKLQSAGPAVGFHSGEPGYLVQFSGQTGWVDGSMVTQAFQGAGVGGPARKHAGGSRSAAPVWHDAHPKIGAPVRYPHFVRAVGGPGNHQREIHRVASQAGVHPARVAMLNPVPTGMIRVA